MTSKITIRSAHTGAEREAAIDYISENMRNKHGSCPPRETSPPHIFIALHGETIVGSLGMVFGDAKKLLPFELQFEFDPRKAPVQYVRKQTVYYSRWNSSRPGIGAAVWLAASRHAIRCGMIYSAQTIKDEMIERYLAFGCVWHLLPDTAVRTENIGESERMYFFGEPGPHPWLGVLKEQMHELPSVVMTIAQKWGYEFDM